MAIKSSTSFILFLPNLPILPKYYFLPFSNTNFLPLPIYRHAGLMPTLDFTHINHRRWKFSACTYFLSLNVPSAALSSPMCDDGHRCCRHSKAEAAEAGAVALLARVSRRLLSSSFQNARCSERFVVSDANISLGYRLLKGSGVRSNRSHLDIFLEDVRKLR